MQNSLPSGSATTMDASSPVSTDVDSMCTEADQAVGFELGVTVSDEVGMVAVLTSLASAVGCNQTDDTSPATPTGGHSLTRPRPVHHPVAQCLGRKLHHPLDVVHVECPFAKRLVTALDYPHRAEPRRGTPPEASLIEEGSTSGHRPTPASRPESGDARTSPGVLVTRMTSSSPARRAPTAGRCLVSLLVR